MTTDERHPFTFADASPAVDRSHDSYGIMQYVNSDGKIDAAHDGAVAAAAQRCALVRGAYKVLAVGDSYDELCARARECRDGLLEALRHDENTNVSWCVRSRYYGPTQDGTMPRFGISHRSSPNRERKAVMAMKPFLETFHGPVRLEDPVCALYVFEGLEGAGKILARKLAAGAPCRVIAPNTRRCITETPLCPVAAYIMCNLARVKEGDRVLDPFSGSCSTLLASAMIGGPDCWTVGIDIAGEDVVDRNNILADFASRGLTAPVALVNGDCTDADVRAVARAAVRGAPFDAILADPPYGRRERLLSGAAPPLVRLTEGLAADRCARTPLLKPGGRLVAFVPIKQGENVEDGLLSRECLDAAGLRLLSVTEQPLSRTLSRWLAVYECT